MKIEKILEYQALDAALKKLEDELSGSADQKAMDEMLKVSREAKGISATLEKEAEKTVIEWNKMQKNYRDAQGSLARIEASQSGAYTEEQCAEIVKQLNNIAAYLVSLEKRMRQTAEKVNAILAEYDAARENFNKAKQKHAVHKQNVENLKAKLEPQMAEIEKKLKVLEGGLEPEILKRYNAIRKDKPFPIVVELRGNVCGGCGMELPSALIEKLKKDGFLECENERCQRIIYIKS